MKKVISIVAGPNGSGKTTFAETFLSKSKIPFLNPDIIASGLGSINFEKASFQAGRVLLTEIKDKIKKGESFAFESTLSGLTYAKLLREARNQGFKIIIYFSSFPRGKLRHLCRRCRAPTFRSLFDLVQLNSLLLKKTSINLTL